jgi:hypothetical protein
MIAVGGLALLQGLDQTPAWTRPARPGAQPDRRPYRQRPDHRYGHLRRQRRELHVRLGLSFTNLLSLIALLAIAVPWPATGEGPLPRREESQATGGSDGPGGHWAIAPAKPCDQSLECRRRAASAIEPDRDG